MVITVTCPSCSSSFPVDPAKIPEGGVNARCSMCSDIFRIEKPVEPDPIPTLDAFAPDPVADVPEPAPSFDEPAMPDPAPSFDEPVMPDPAPSFGEPAMPDPAPSFDEPVMPDPAPSFEAPAMPDPAPAFDEPVMPDPLPAFDDPDPVADPSMPAAMPAMPPIPPLPDPVPPAPPADPFGEAAPFEAAAPFEQAEPTPPPLPEIPEVAEPLPAPPADPLPPMPEPTTPEPEAPAVQGFTFGKRDPTDKARRLARVLVSDMIMYNAERHQNALAAGTLAEDFEEEIDKSWKEYVEQVGDELAAGPGQEFWIAALNDILAKGEQVF